MSWEVGDGTCMDRDNFGNFLEFVCKYREKPNETSNIFL
jgi:hypothetical protein